MRALLALTVALALLVACGKKGPPDPPGPPDRITYPKSFPTH
jgi:predicted small lipoprotein YifL